MDIARPSNLRQKRIRRAVYGIVGLSLVVLITLGVSRLKPAAPGVERATVWIDTVKRGPMLRDERGIGTLVPEDIRWIPATTVGRVERIALRPGTVVAAGSVILELSNPQLEQELQDATLKLKAAEASLTNLRVQLQNDTLAQEAITASIEADYKKAALQVEANQQLAAKGLVSEMTLKQATLDADQLSARYAIARKQLASHAESMQVPAGRAGVRSRSNARDRAPEAAAGGRTARPRRVRGRAAGRARRSRPAGGAGHQPRARRRSRRASRPN